MMDPGSHDPELDLQAMRYIVGEMTEAEATAFETRLASDQAARDSVEQSVLVAAAVSGDATFGSVSSSDEISADRDSTGLRLVSNAQGPRVGRFVAAAAALWIAVVAGWWLLRSPADSPAANSDTTPVAAGSAAEEGQPDLLASWADLQELEAADAEAGENENDELDGLDLWDQETPGELPDGDELAAVETPAWMLEALAK